MKRLITALAVFLCLIFCRTALGDAPISSVDATSWIVGKDPNAYTPIRMVDGDETTAFQFSTKKTKLGNEYIYFTFSSPSNISALWIKNGFWKMTNGLDQYTRNSRVKSMTVSFRYASGDYTDAISVTLPDDKSRSNWTSVQLGNHYQVSAVRFCIESIYKGSKYPNDVCISEVRFVDSSAILPSGDLYGLATQKLATRRGPGTNYDGGGTYNVAGQYIKVISRAWDSRNSIWWVKCEIPYKGDIRVRWTGYKRFDSSTLPLESIPIESTNNTYQTVAPSTPIPNEATLTSANDWSSAYYQFVTSGQYTQYIKCPYPGTMYEELFAE